MSFLDGRKSNRLNCCSGCCAVEFPLRFNISNGEPPRKGFLSWCSLLLAARHDLLPLELARDSGDMHRVAAEARIVAEVGFHPLFDFRVVQSHHASPECLLQLLPIEVVGNVVSVRWVDGRSG